VRVPESLLPLVEQGTIERVIRPLMSGKEADVYLVESQGEIRVAKVYKEAAVRAFKHRSGYEEGRKVRNSRQQRAISKRSKFGKEQAEAAWRTAEVDAIYKLYAADVAVPAPYDFVENVLVMELVAGKDGEAAPRLADCSFSKAEARRIFDFLLKETVKMLLAGVVHGDLSDFNVLMSDNGPVIIDFPQWTDPAHNTNARKFLVRDVDNLQSFLGRYDRSLRNCKFGREIWGLYEDGELRIDTHLTGTYTAPTAPVEMMSLLEEIEAAEQERADKRERLGLGPARPARKPVEYTSNIKPRSDGDGGGRRKRGRRRGKSEGQEGSRDSRPRRGPAPGTVVVDSRGGGESTVARPKTEGSDNPKRRRRRRRNPRSGGES
jgi:RIO kinase 1